MAKILVVDDEPYFCDLIKMILSSEGHQVETAPDVETALGTVEDFGPDLILSDIRMPGTDGIEFLKKVKEKHSDIDFILMTAYGSKDTAVEALRLGARDYLEKPFDNTELKQRVANLTDRKRLVEENAALHGLLDKRWRLPNMIGQSAGIQEIAGLVSKVAPKFVSVLIRGESGTGKELVARAIHAHSPQHLGPFVGINSGAMPETLLESELFGHEKGAFTGADRQKKGKFEIAAGGTLFLDEIGDISPGMQVKLLRVLAERRFTRVGGNETIECTARIVTATNRNLEELIRQGKFREDLYYRLNIFPIHVPPLRQRREDIPLLVEHFLQKSGAPPDAIGGAVLKSLVAHDWPGNIRELENTIERATILSGNGSIDREHLPLQIRTGYTDAGSSVVEFEIPDGGISLDALEQQLIHQALRKANGNKTRAAQLLGITRRSLYSRLETFEKDRDNTMEAKKS